MSIRSVVLALYTVLFAAMALDPGALALAETKKRPGAAHSQTRHQYCLAESSWCYGACNDIDDTINGSGTIIDPFFLPNCEQACSSAMDSCEAAMVAPGDVMSDAGVLVEQTTFGLEPVSEPKVKGACGRVVGAHFASAEGNYGCINPTCGDKGGVCTVTCIKGKCFGALPGAPEGPLTLLGILQGGSGVAKDPAAPDTDSGASESGGGDGGGGGVIIY